MRRLQRSNFALWTTASLALLLQAGGAGASSASSSGCTRFAGAEKPGCASRADARTSPSPLDPTGLYFTYRLVNHGEGQRRCRLHPTCSYFTLAAIRRMGFLPGLLAGLARAQMEHADQGGYLRKSVASDHRFVYLDPLEHWLHDHESAQTASH